MDNAQEFKGKEMNDFLTEAGIAANYSSPYTHEDNPIAERAIQTCQATAKTLRVAAGFPKYRSLS
jgi:hypothetical protein